MTYAGILAMLGSKGTCGRRTTRWWTKGWQPNPKGVFVARDRPTASNEHSSLPPLYAARPTAVDTLTRAETRALSRCAPLRRAADPAEPSVSSGHWEVAAERTQVGFLHRQVAAFATLAGMPAGGLPSCRSPCPRR